jgi:hypothetical protein
VDREFLEGLGIEGENIDLILEKSNSEISRERLINSAKTEMSKRGVKNIDAAMRLFDMEGMEDESLSERIDSFVLENDFLFEQNNPKPVFSGNVSSEKETGVTKDEFNKMGYIERLKLFNENPEAYRQLTE